ncbi:hypothetical protein JCM10449v2_004947 [Rhodotorula kratochvilovae]
MNPAPSSSAGRRPRASLASLPTELLKQIVAEVNKQDKAFAGVERAPHSQPSAYGPRLHAPANDEGKRRDRRTYTGVDVVWSYWHGRGTSALSYVNKKLRSLALPFLFDTVTSKQACSSLAGAALSGSSVPRMVRYLDCYSDWTDWAQAAATALRLQGVKELTLGDENSAALLEPSEDSAACTILRHAFANLAHHIEVLDFFPLNYNVATDLLDLLTCPSALHVLRITASGNPLVTNLAKFRGGLSGLSLEKLDITDSHDSWTHDDEADPPEVDATWFGAFSLPTVKTSGFTAERPPPERPPPERFLEFVAHAFPNLEHLRISINGHSLLHSPAEPTRGLSAQVLPHLEHLTLGDNHATDLLFAHFILRSSPSMSGHPPNLLAKLKGLFPPDFRLPPTLRRIHCDTQSPSRPGNAAEDAALVAWAAHCGVQVPFQSARRTEPLGYVRHARIERMLQARRREKGARAAVRDATRSALQWALKRVDSLARARDVAGLLELDEACRPLMERWSIEEL